mgnify:FL=1
MALADTPIDFSEEISQTWRTLKNNKMSKQGDTENVGKLIKENQPRLRTFIEQRVPNKEDAEDILQDVFYQLVKTLENTTNPIGQVTAWLYHVARNMIINKGKKKHEEELPVIYEEDEDDEEDFLENLSETLFNSDHQTPETEYLRSLFWQELETTLTELPTEQRKAFELTEMEGLSVKEAAQQEKVPVNTLLSRKHYAITLLRTRLENLYNDIIDF